MIRKPALLFILIVIYDVIFIFYFLFVLFISIIYLFGKTLQDFINDLWCFKSGDYFPLFSNCIYQCILYTVIIYHILFIIVVLILLYLSYCVNVCHVFVCILSVYFGTTMEISACTFLYHPFISCTLYLDLMYIFTMFFIVY